MAIQLKMRSILLIATSFCILPLMSMAQHSLTIEVTDLRSNNGYIHLELSNEKEVKIVGITKKISNNRCIIVIENLKQGKYAFRFFHDENMNEKLDVNWLGIPKEGFGFSNNPSMSFGPPSFDKTVFELNESRAFKCITKYF
jgi:uncharacterized protein (DUF2141 family)